MNGKQDDHAASVRDRAAFDRPETEGYAVEDNSTAVILFDGMCNLCSGIVQFVIPRDPKRHFRFASLQSETGRMLLSRCQLPTDRFNSFVVVHGATCRTKSDAALYVCSRLTGGWRLLRVFAAVPRPIRDRVYDWVARNRYRWFGQRSSCFMPDRERDRERFLP